MKKPKPKPPASEATVTDRAGLYELLRLDEFRVAIDDDEAAAAEVASYKARERQRLIEVVESGILAGEALELALRMRMAHQQERES